MEPRPIPVNFDGPCYHVRKLDQGPILNIIGKLCKTLLKLGLNSPRDVFAGNVPRPTWNKLKREL